MVLVKRDVGARVLDKLNAELKYISLMYENDRFDRARLNELVGKLNLAIELELITFAQWEEYIEKILLIINGD